MIGGGVLAVPSGPPGVIAGAGLGYAMGRKGADLYEQSFGLKEPKDALTEISETGKDFVTGTGMEMGGALIGKGIRAAAQYLSQAPAERLYGSAIKLPLSKKWTEVLPGREVSKRTQAVEAGLENRIPPSEYGVEKITSLEKQARSAVDDIIDVGAAQGDTVVTEDLIKKGLAKAYERASKSSDPVGAKSLVDDIAEKFRAHGDTVPTDKLNAIKRQLYDEVKWGGTEATALATQLTTMGKKGIAHEAMVSLEELYPQIAVLNKNDASYIALKEAIERATARMGNNDIVGLSTKMLGVRSLPMAVFEWTIGHPQVKSRLAFALRKVGQAQGNVVSKPTAYMIGRGINEDEIPPKPPYR
jgi:hypothetical protein